MFCKNCGNKLTEGQMFCTNCGTKQESVENNVVAGNNPEPTITSSTPVGETNPVSNNGMNNNSNSNVNMSNVNNMNESNGMNNQNQMADNMNNNNGMNNIPNSNANVPNLGNVNDGNVNNNQNQMMNNMNNNNAMNNQNQMGNNMNMNNNPSGNNNGAPKKTSAFKIVLIIFVIAFVLAFLVTAPMIMTLIEDSKDISDRKNDTETEVGKVEKVENQKVFSGFKFTIPEGYTANISDAGELVLTKEDVTYTILVDNSTYEANVQYIITAQPRLKDGLEGTINNRKIAAMYVPKYQCALLLTKASDTQTFFVLIARESGKADMKEIREIVDILNKVEKDESTFSEGIESNSDIKDKISEDNGSALENFKFE